MKNQSRPFTVDESVAVLRNAHHINSSSTVDLDKMFRECSQDELKEFDHFLRHDRTNTIKKVETYGKYLPPVMKMVKLRDWIDEVIQKSCDIINDETVKTCGGTPDDFDFEDLKAMISEKIGEKSSSADATMMSR
eukprot:Skav215460  [mRNA]  locus=scaffold1089:3197:3601:- [translate_table: standard]